MKLLLFDSKYWRQQHLEPKINKTLIPKRLLLTFSRLFITANCATFFRALNLNAVSGKKKKKSFTITNKLTQMQFRSTSKNNCPLTHKLLCQCYLLSHVKVNTIRINQKLYCFCPLKAKLNLELQRLWVFFLCF